MTLLGSLSLGEFDIGPGKVLGYFFVVVVNLGLWMVGRSTNQTEKNININRMESLPFWYRNLNA